MSKSKFEIFARNLTETDNWLNTVPSPSEFSLTHHQKYKISCKKIISIDSAMSTGETQVSFHVQLNCDLIESEDFFNFTQFFEKITKIIFPYSCKAQNKNEDTHLHCFLSLISFKNTLKSST